MLSISKLTKYRINKKGQKVYRLDYGNHKYLDFTIVELFINPDRYYLDKVVIYFKNSQQIYPGKQLENPEKPRLEIVFSDFDTNPGLDSNRFRDEQYIIITSSDIRCSQNYKDFHLINQKIELHND